jgi:putative membrane protein
VGLVLFYELIGNLLTWFPIPVSFLFFGAVIGGIPALLKTIKPQKVTAGFCVSSALWGVLGAAIILLITNIPHASLVNFSAEFTLANVLSWMLVGFVIAIALVLPGISTSHMLIVLGITSIMRIPLHALAVIGVAGVISIFVITKPLEWAMKRFTVPTYSVIIGFVLGSLWQIFNEKVIPDLFVAREWWMWVIYAACSLVTFVGGLFGLLYLSRFSED